jgi:hypothetical protein
MSVENTHKHPARLGDWLSERVVIKQRPTRVQVYLLLIQHNHYIITVDRGTDGIRVMFWYHRQFIEAAQDRYLSGFKTTGRLHSSLADFFSGIWANGKYYIFGLRTIHNTLECVTKYFSIVTYIEIIVYIITKSQTAYGITSLLSVTCFLIANILMYMARVCVLIVNVKFCADRSEAIHRQERSQRTRT